LDIQSPIATKAVSSNPDNERDVFDKTLCDKVLSVTTTWLRLFLHEPNKYCDQSLSIFSFFYAIWFYYCLRRQFMKLGIFYYLFIRFHCVIKFCQWLPAYRWFSPGTPVSLTNKTDIHDIAKILLKVALNTIILSQ
jgi:hypothetical protein